MNRSDGSTADYYVLPEGATQLQDLISHRNMNAQIGEIIRACYRYGMASHSDMLRDAKKIRFYAQAEVDRLEKLEAASEQCGQVELPAERLEEDIINDDRFIDKFLLDYPWIKKEDFKDIYLKIKESNKIHQ